MSKKKNGLRKSGTAAGNREESRPDGAGGVSRRRLIGSAGAAGAAGLVLGAAGGATTYATTREERTALTTVGSTEAMFHGKHQAGITTPLQARGHLVAFDLVPGAGRKEAAALLRRWSAVAQRLMAGEVAKGGPGHDTGVALDAGPSSLTVTFGFGRTFFARTGLDDRRPAALDPLPAFSSDHLDAKRSDGDLWVQIGADDALVAFHALRALQKEAGSSARVRWQMNGFNRTPGATARPMTARNLMGQVDGTNNPARRRATSRSASSCRPTTPRRPPGWPAVRTPWSGGSGCSWTTGRSSRSSARNRSSDGARRTAPLSAVVRRAPRWTWTGQGRTESR